MTVLFRKAVISETAMHLDKTLHFRNDNAFQKHFCSSETSMHFRKDNGFQKWLCILEMAMHS